MSAPTTAGGKLSKCCSSLSALVKSTWEALNFAVRVYTNLKAEEMVTLLMQTGFHTDHSAYDAFVLCVMTHGSLQHVYGSDGL